MYSRYIESCRIDKSTFLQLGLCLIWSAGLSLGLLTARFYGDALGAYIRAAAQLVPDLWGSLCVNVFPLLISAFAVICFFPALPVIVVLRGMLIGLGIGAVYRTYGGAGDMMSMLLLFSTVVYTPVLLWFWCSLVEQKKVPGIDFAVCILAGLAVAAADIWLTAPFLREVLMD